MNIAFWNSQSSAPASPSLTWHNDGTGTNAKMDIKKNGVTVVLPVLVDSGTFPVVVGDVIDVHIAKAVTGGAMSERLIVLENGISIHNEVSPIAIFYTFSIVSNVPYDIGGTVEPT